MLRALPGGVSGRAFRAAADAATVRNGRGTQQLRRNLRRVVGPSVSELRMDALVGDALRSYSRYWLETFRLPSMDLDDVVARTDVHTYGREHIEAGLAAGKGVIVALPHSGNWEISWCLAGRAARPVHHRRGAAQARVAVRPLRRVPRGPRHGGPAVDRW